ncbi:lipopolysaccharide assembly protein LapB [Pseudoalteromonas shioyasakiensis]|uniref:Lipopolysaccharide assembly protein LapB n=1 Tax=Pseudoalteromonas shioyasakiensis TaxID=1190813 RepID=A0ABT6TVQ8_9GAMM|nr:MULTISPECIES: lipopolysaccharide assembly protein LapB [Pseudoalteromonas]MDI4667993.1 lipopolysaccharide assembly protein LapB [Pseudoalteromonas shioyasakiensis]MDI4672777.1 lipopolysaccharide assembly protein LapB [Pseudoalteromonas shioyasakiensis]MDI4684841.1 lipopolysaccharide assembly protein LapB [Pseudoalteromonas shioyasakiensis]MDI4703195.1 lipopolysaccharide assembly protein LapB [Pseudoalteromonas shioyasakiensis]NUJ20178.1 lipopolysaccharide assembly protein LapB [Pseudoaltero
MIELLFLLLPVAAGYGWIMGKNSAKNQAHQLNRQITSEYSKGLKFLLDREEDQGLEHLINLLEVAADSVEHYSTLATMFRRRGELDRAIKIHELLLKHPSLDEQQAATSRLELAEDYIMAGLLDGAEEHLVWLVKAGYKEALEPIINLYSQTREWEKGINMYEVHSELFTKPQHVKAIANFYCEAALQDNDTQIMRKAISLNHKAIRPLYELGHSAFTKEDYVKAIYYWRELISQFTFFAPVFIEELALSYQKLNLTHQFYELLNELLDKGGVLIKIKHCQALLEQGHIEQAIKFLTDSLKRHPTIRGFSFLLQLLAKQNNDIKDVLDQIDKLVTSYIATKPDFQCQHCGFTSHTIYWVCPSCKHWETIVPSRGIDGF